jgi:hypothetical protein
MSDERDRPKIDEDASTRPVLKPDDRLQLDDGPLKQHGDALRDGSGSRQGQSPPNVGPREST